ncbi:MAG: DUF4118 domain-containing protein [Lachnospiraceae bacterium]
MSTKVRSVLKNSGIAFGILGIATAFCFLVQRISESDTHVPLLFVLAVLFVSRFTDGYVYGIVASIIAVFRRELRFYIPIFQTELCDHGIPADLRRHAGRGLQRQRPDDPDQETGADAAGG